MRICRALAGMTPNKVTFISILSACTSQEALDNGKKIHAEVIKAGLESDVRVGTALLSMYARCGSPVDAQAAFDGIHHKNVYSWTALLTMYCKHNDLHNASQVFHKMPTRDAVAWNVMIAGYSQHLEYADQVLTVFDQMQREGVKPTKVTFMIVLSACADLTAVEEGSQVHAQITKAGFETDFCVGSALVDMYAKCGSLADARHVFDKMPNKDTIAWTAVITGYAQHGDGKESIRLFREMVRQGVSPDEVTFVGLLTACSHMGFVDTGCHYFELMIQEHGIQPTLKHFGCMVHLLGRANCFEEAHKLITAMPIEPDSLTWGALLGACRVHNNVELAELAAEEQLKLQPKNPAAVFMLLSNIYAAASRWNDVAKIRKVMKAGHEYLKLDLHGHTWIEVDNKLKEFCCMKDKSHTCTGYIERWRD
jgi:pentatricopeptide repeat protein